MIPTDGLHWTIVSCIQHFIILYKEKLYDVPTCVVDTHENPVSV